MSEDPNKIWEEYRLPFSAFDDITLARWMAQTLAQFEGRTWRLSHPLIMAYRAASEVGNDRQIWLKRLATPPAAFAPADCCRAPLLPLFTRDIVNTGLLCQHCGATAVEWDDLPDALRREVEPWARSYGEVHAVAHYDEKQMEELDDYDEAYEEAALQAEQALRTAALEILPAFLEHYTAIVWEDQDECLEVEPKDIPTWE